MLVRSTYIPGGNAKNLHNAHLLCPTANAPREQELTPTRAIFEAIGIWIVTL